MLRVKMVSKILVATGNRHKTEEISAMLGSGWLVEDLKHHPNLTSPEETGETFEDNAAIKALAASRELPGVLVLSDDSGLEVDVLQGQPGVHSARYAGVGATDADNRNKLKAALKELGTEVDRKGRFRCCMVLALDGEVKGVFNGAVEGQLLLKEEGAGGFGYDALFVPEGYEHSFGVLPPEVKNQLSHRSRALSQVITWLDTQRVQ